MERPARESVAGQGWVSRKVSANGVVYVGAQQVSVGKDFSGTTCDVLVSHGYCIWIGDQLVKAAARTDPRPIRKKRAAGTSPRR